MLTLSKLPYLKQTSKPSLSPQQYLDALLRTRGYSPDTHSTLLTAYYNSPSKLQIASYGNYTTDLVQNGRLEQLFEVFSLGLSPNACNVHGESIVHTACRLSKAQTLGVLVEAGCDVQISDNNGRTPLHDACSAAEPNFQLVEKLLDIDQHLLFLADKRGHLPLSYTRQEHWSDWLQFLESKKNEYWPLRHDADEKNTAELTRLMPHSRPVRDPTHALSLDMTRRVASGRLQPSEVSVLVLDVCGEITDCDSYADSNDVDIEEDDADDTSINICSPSFDMPSEQMRYDDSWNVVEMKNILESIDSPIKRPLHW